MTENIKYINLREILSRVLDHPMLQDVNLESAIRYSLDFMSKMGLPEVYTEKVETIEIENYRGKLPCDLIIVNQVRDHKTQYCMAAMTDNFNGMDSNMVSQPTFKTQGSIIYTSFCDGCVDISYKAINVDEDGIPMIPENPVFLDALENFIKVKRFRILFDQGKIPFNVYHTAKQEYIDSARTCQGKFATPSESEMESITNVMHQLIPRMNEFKYGFKNLADKEYTRFK
jgi:hypothetical protein